MTKKKQDIIEISGTKGTGEDANGLWWVNKARNTDETRKALLHIHIENGYATASDGRRLHRYKLTSKGKDGLYIPLVCKRKQVVLERTNDATIKYPDIDSMLMGRPDSENIPELCRDVNIAIGELLRMASDNHYINYDYLKDAMDSNDITFEVWHAPKEDDNPFYLRSYQRTAIIMPMRQP